MPPTNNYNVACTWTPSFEPWIQGQDYKPPSTTITRTGWHVYPPKLSQSNKFDQSLCKASILLPLFPLAPSQVAIIKTMSLWLGPPSSRPLHSRFDQWPSHCYFTIYTTYAPPPFSHILILYWFSHSLIGSFSQAFFFTEHHFFLSRHRPVIPEVVFCLPHCDLHQSPVALLSQNPCYTSIQDNPC